MTRSLLRLFNKAGTKASPEKVRALADSLNAILADRFFAKLEGGDGGDANENKRLMAVHAQCLDLLAEMEGMTPEAAATPMPRSTAWEQAADKPPSKAAAGVLHDAQVARHRRGGVVKPRPRWSIDEMPPEPKAGGRTEKDERNFMLAQMWAHRQK